MANRTIVPQCPETYGGSAFSYATFVQPNAGFYQYHHCHYVNGTGFDNNLWVLEPVSSGGGMSATQLDMLMFGFLMVMWCIGVVLGVRLTQTRTRYGGDA